MKRRIISLLFLLLLLMPLGYSMAANTPSATITSDDVNGNVGDTVTVTLNIAITTTKLGQTMDSLQFVLNYDSASLEFVSIQEVSQDRIKILGAEYMCSVTPSTGKVAFAAASTDGAAGSGVLMHIKFKILSAVSTVLTLKNVSYSFVANGNVQDRKQGGTVNLGRITGQSAPSTIAPTSTYPTETAQATPPSGTSVPTDEPRFPVTEVTDAPGKSPKEEPEDTGNDALAYIVFGLFIVVAILICVVLTLMIVRRGRNKAGIKYFEDDEEDESEPIMPSEREEPRRRRPVREEEEDDVEDEDDMPIRIVRRRK